MMKLFMERVHSSLECPETAGSNLRTYAPTSPSCGHIPVKNSCLWVLNSPSPANGQVSGVWTGIFFCPESTKGSLTWSPISTDPEERKQLAAIEEQLGVKPASLEPGSNWGTLILDATCVPDDIPYPVDLRLLAESRETAEKVIDELFKQLQETIPRKPRCNCIKAHNLYLAIIKKKKPSR